MSDTGDGPGLSDRVSEIRRELGRLFTQQTEFFRKAAQKKHTSDEIREYEERRERIRELFAELSELITVV
jgi:hypothetical protein